MIQDFCDELNTYLKKRYKYIKNPARANFSNINVSRSACDLYLRFKPKGNYGSETLVIARIRFKRKGKGNGRDFLKFLVDRSEKYNFERIGIEQTLTEDGQLFAKRYGFQNSFDKNNWIINVNDLKDNLISIT